MKFWFFVEGESEMEFARHLIRTVYSGAREVSDLVEFINAEAGSPPIFNCYDCNSIDNVPFRIREQSGRAIKSGALVVVVGDLEKLLCNSLRRELIISKINNDALTPLLRFVFTKPQIEAVYWHYPNVLKRTVKKLIGLQNGESQMEVSLPSYQVQSNFKGELRTLCKTLGVRYHPGEFAEHFFGILGVDLGDHPVISRFISILSPAEGSALPEASAFPT